MYKLLSLTVALGLLLSAAALGGFFANASGSDTVEDSKDWPQWRGPHRDAVSTEKNLLKEWPENGPPLLWNSRTVNGGKSVGSGWSTVAIAEGKIYTTGSQSGPDGGCFVYCLDEQTGKQLWASKFCSEHHNPQSTPTVDGDKVYVLSYEAKLACLDTAKGDIVWQKDLRKEFKAITMNPSYGHAESVLVDGDKVVCTPGSDDAALVAFNKKTGEVIWKTAITEVRGSGFGSIVIAEVGGIRQYVTLLGIKTGLAGVDASTGKLLWKYANVGKGESNIATPVVKGDLVFASNCYNGGSALVKLVPKDDGIEAKVVYYLDGNTLETMHGGMVLVGDKIYGGHGYNNGMPYCLDLMSGKLDWKVGGAGSGSAGVIYADGNLYFRYANNVMALVEANPKGYKLKSKFHLPKDIDSGFPHPVILHGRLYIRGRDQILCYDIKQK